MLLFLPGNPPLAPSIIQILSVIQGRVQVLPPQTVEPTQMSPLHPYLYLSFDDHIVLNLVLGPEEAVSTYLLNE